MPDRVPDDEKQSDWLDDLRRFGASIDWPELPADLMRKFGRFSGRKLPRTQATYQALRRDYYRLRSLRSIPPAQSDQSE